MKAPKQLGVALIEREKQLFNTAQALEAAGFISKNLGARSDLVLMALGVDPDKDGFFSDYHSDSFWEGLEAGDTAEEIYAAMLARIEGAAR